MPRGHHPLPGVAGTLPSSTRRIVPPGFVAAAAAAVDTEGKENAGDGGGDDAAARTLLRGTGAPPPVPGGATAAATAQAQASAMARLHAGQTATVAPGAGASGAPLDVSGSWSPSRRPATASGTMAAGSGAHSSGIAAAAARSAAAGALPKFSPLRPAVNTIVLLSSRTALSPMALRLLPQPQPQWSPVRGPQSTTYALPSMGSRRIALFDESRSLLVPSPHFGQVGQVCSVGFVGRGRVSHPRSHFSLQVYVQQPPLVQATVALPQESRSIMPVPLASEATHSSRQLSRSVGPSYRYAATTQSRGAPGPSASVVLQLGSASRSMRLPPGQTLRAESRGRPRTAIRQAAEKRASSLGRTPIVSTGSVAPSSPSGAGLVLRRVPVHPGPVSPSAYDGRAGGAPPIPPHTTSVAYFGEGFQTTGATSARFPTAVSLQMPG